MLRQNILSTLERCNLFNSQHIHPVCPEQSTDTKPTTAMSLLKQKKQGVGTSPPCDSPFHTDNLASSLGPDIYAQTSSLSLSVIRVHEQAVIIVPTLLLLATLVTLLALCIMRYCPQRKRTRTTVPQHYRSSSHRQTQRNSHRHHLQGIDGKQACICLCQFSSYSHYIFPCTSNVQTTSQSDLLFCSVFISLSLLTAPPGINPLEHEELPMSVQQVQQNVRPTVAAVPQLSTERHHGAFSQVTALPLSFSIKPGDTVSIYRARMDNRDVILRVLRGKELYKAESPTQTSNCLLHVCREMFCFALFSAREIRKMV